MSTLGEILRLRRERKRPRQKENYGRVKKREREEDRPKKNTFGKRRARKKEREQEEPIEYSIDGVVRVDASFSVKQKERPKSIDPRFDITKSFSLGEKTRTREKYWYAYDKQEERVNELYNERNKEGYDEVKRRKIQRKENQMKQIVMNKRVDQMRKRIVDDHYKKESAKVEKTGKKPWVLNKSQVDTLLRKRQLKEVGGTKKFMKRKRRKIMKTNFKVKRRVHEMKRE